MVNRNENLEKLKCYCANNGVLNAGVNKIISKCRMLIEIRTWEELKPDVHALIAEHKRQLNRNQGK